MLCFAEEGLFTFLPLRCFSCTINLLFCFQVKICTKPIVIGLRIHFVNTVSIGEELSRSPACLAFLLLVHSTSLRGYCFCILQARQS